MQVSGSKGHEADFTAWIMSACPNPPYYGPYIVLRMMEPHNMAVKLMAKDGTVRVAPIINMNLYRGQDDISKQPAKSLRVVTVGTSFDSNIRAYLDSEDESMPRMSTS